MSVIQEERKRLRHLRRAVSPKAREQAALALLMQVASLDFLPLVEKVALYAAHDGEIDPVYLTQYLWAQGKQCYLPVIEVGDEKKLRFALFTPQSQMRVNHFGIEEPVTDVVLSASELDLIFLPLVAFDHNGNRLGRGGGFYDATLAQHETKPWRVGLGYEFQCIDALPAQPHDVILHAVVTDQHCYEISK